MARFMDVHDGFVGVTAEQLREAHQRDLEVEAAEGVHFEHAWLDPQAGKVFCLSSRPSKEAVLRVHEKAGPHRGDLRAADRGRLARPGAAGRPRPGRGLASL
jgi:hypothetical protein